ncbi:helix-turn-helix transcriptional regulator [Streptomyces stramineus]
MSAAEAAVQANRVLQHEPAAPDHVHTGLTLLCAVLTAAESLETIGPWLTTARERARRDATPVPRATIAVELAHTLLARGRLQDARTHTEEALALGVTEWATLPSLTAVVTVALHSRDAGLTRRLLAHRHETGDHDFRPSPSSSSGDPSRRPRETRPRPWSTSSTGAARRNAPSGATPPSPPGAPGRPGSSTGWAAPAGPRPRRRGVRTVRGLGHPHRHRPRPAGPGRDHGGERGIELLRESADTLERSVNTMETARTDLLLGRRLLAAGRFAEGEVRLRRARDRALSCGVPWIAEQACRELADPAGSRNPVAVAALTRAERRVAGLAAHGTPNKEIAERLEVSSRAVEKHLTSAYRKLHVAGRSELAVLAPLLPGPEGD